MNKSIVTFTRGTLAQATPLWQYDYGQVLEINGLDLPATYQVHFCNCTDTQTITVLGNADGVLIPDNLLQTGKTVIAYIYLHTGADDGETEYKITIPIRTRPAPSDIPPTPEQQSALDEAIAALNSAVENVEEIADGIPDQIDEALSEAKESGEFDGPQGPEGPQGATGPAGPAGAAGEDGYSPTVTVTEITGGHRVTITDKNGDHSFDVMDGQGDSGGGGLTDDIKQALLQIAQKVAYIDDQGQTYYQDLYDALYPPKPVVSITATYTQSGTVYDTDTLDSLKADLVVTATYDDQSTAIIPATAYTLSGTLTEGTSTITVSYEGKTATFSVTVTHATVQYSITNDLTNVTTSNAQTAINSGEAYTATLTATTGYDITSVSVVMGGQDITATAYSDGGISISSVTGNLVITATATEHVAVLDRITADFTQSGTVYDTDTLDVLRDMLVVTAYYDNGYSVVVTEYTLSGTLTVGTSTITATYDGQTATFSVTVSSAANIVRTVAFDQSGKLVDMATGAVTSNASWKATSLIEIPDGFDWLGWTAASASYRGAIYDANENYIIGLNNSTAIANATRVTNEIPSNAKYIRICTIKSSGPDTIEMRYGHSFVRDVWSAEAVGYINNDGSIDYSNKRQLITDFVPIPSGATLLLWSNRMGYSFNLATVAVYDSNKNFLSLNRGDGSASYFYSPKTKSLTGLTDPAYIRAGVSANSVETNNDPAAQMIYAYFGAEVS